MKNPTKSTILSLFALGAGAVGLYLLTWLFATGADSSGLLRTTHPAHSIVYIITAITMLVLYLFLRTVKEELPYRQLFPTSLPALIGSIVAAICILATDVYEMLQQNDTITLVTCIVGVPAAVCLVMAEVRRMGRARPHYGLYAAVTIYLMLHLVSQYRTWSSEPQLINYSFQLLASVCLLLSSYHRTMLYAGSGNRRNYAFFTGGALFFCCLAINYENRLFYLAMAVWMATAQCSLEPKKKFTPMHLPKKVLFCICALEDAGYDAYAVGGCVRDSLLGLTPQDYDMCTSATPVQITNVFSKHPLVRSGEKHGTVGVVMDGEVYEITTFRTEGSYSDSRHPDWVEFVTSIKEDLARRDFTINAIAYSPSEGYIDPWGGQADLNAQLLRTVGDPETRFREDALRILRGVRFAARFQLTPDVETEKAMFAQAPLMDNLAKERIFSELCKLLPLVTAEDLIHYAPIFTQIIPELAPTVDFQQCNPHHVHDVYTHTAQTVEAAPPELALRLAALLHDIGKPATFTTDENGVGHFFGHAKVSAEMANELLLRLKAPNALRNQVVSLIEHHMTAFEPDKKLLRRRLGQFGEETVMQMLQLQKADFGSKGTEEDNDPFSPVEALISEILEEDACLTVKSLDITGHDLLALGIEPGPNVGACMNFLLGMVQDELLSNTKEELLTAAKKFFANLEDV